MKIVIRFVQALAVRGGKIGALSVVISAAWIGCPSAARSDSVNSPNIQLNVDANRAAATGPGAGDAFVVVNTITLAEITLPEYSSGSGKAVTLRAKPGFQFDPTSNITAQSATIGINGGGLNAVATVVPSGAADEVITFNFTSGTNTAVQDVVRINGVRIRILSVAGAVGPVQTTVQLTTSTAGGAFTNQGIIAASIQKGLPDRLLFSIQPGSNQAGVNLLPAVTMVDFGGNIVANDARLISIAIQDNPGGAALNGTNQLTTVNGVATWTDAEGLNITTTGTGYTLRASIQNGDSFHTSDFVDSAPFDIESGNPGSLEISQQPVNTAAGQDIEIEVTARDEFGNVLTGTDVEVSLDSAVNPGGWPLLTAIGSGLTKTTVDGVARWDDADDLRILSAIANYKLSVSGFGTPLETELFDIVPGDAALLRFVQQPTDGLPGAALDPPVSVELTDEFSNRVDSNATVNLSLIANPCGGTLSGGESTAATGLASFAALSIDLACNTYQLQASSEGIPSTESAPFNVIDPNAADACGTCGAGVTALMAPMLLLAISVRGRKHGRKKIGG